MFAAAPVNVHRVVINKQRHCCLSEGTVGLTEKEEKMYSITLRDESRSEMSRKAAKLYVKIK